MPWRIEVIVAEFSHCSRFHLRKPIQSLWICIVVAGWSFGHGADKSWGESPDEASKPVVGKLAVVKSPCAVIDGPDRGQNLDPGTVGECSRIDDERAWLSG